MNTEKVYARITAKDNNDYICPLSAIPSDTPLDVDQLDDCVEADVVGRYSGNLNIISNSA